MRIGIDATALPPRLYGAGNYIAHLIRSLPLIDETNEYLAFVKPDNVTLMARRENLRIVQATLASRVLRIAWEQTFLPLLARRYRLDVLHSPHYTMPFLRPCPTVVTFHDMTFFLYPHMHRFYKKIFFQAAIRLSAKRADAIIADSESTRQDILRVLRSDDKIVTVVPLGVSDAFRQHHDQTGSERMLQKYHLPPRFILSVGVLEPRKNLLTLLHAFKSLAERGIEHSLVIVGQRGWMNDKVFEVAKDLTLSSRVIFTGYVPERDLPFLFSSAEVFVYPSTYEGFGLPVLEALACGIPVITSNVSSMPEIVGDAGILVNPLDEVELADAMQRVLTDRVLHAKLARDGRARSKMFSWERTARETLMVYERVVKRR
jgi:glycosyltransferase involved in cell wall biosynthesis